MAPAIALARDGYVLGPGDTDILDGKRVRQGPGGREDLSATAMAAAWPRAIASCKRAGGNARSDRANRAPTPFTEARSRRRSRRRAATNGGILTARDFADYTVTETPPLTCSYRGYRIVSAPPPSSGGTTICEILNILEGYDLAALGFRSAQSVRLLVEAMRRAYRDRNTHLGDPAFVQNPLDRLLSKDYAAEIRTAIDAGSATPAAALEPPKEKAETTHYSVVDGEGNAVAVTYTINGSFGAGVIAPGTGFFLNNEMDDFTVKPGTPNLYGLVQGEANAIAPGKRPLSSMAPTLVEKDGRVFLVLGSPGGSRIITAVLETILNIVDYGMAPQEAVDSAAPPPPGAA